MGAGLDGDMSFDFEPQIEGNHEDDFVGPAGRVSFWAKRNVLSVSTSKQKVEL